MNRIVIVDNPQISVWVYPEQHIVHHQMKAFCYGANFRAGLLGVIDGMTRHHAIKYLSDNRAGAAVVQEDIDWSSKVWYPRAQAAGWKHWAIVQPASVIGQINMQRHASHSAANRGINSRVFSDPDEAMKWLEEL